MTEYKTLVQEQDAILERLRELDKLDFPQYRSYQRADGTWVDREPVPEYLEQEELICKWQEVRKIEQYFHSEHNPLMICISKFSRRLRGCKKQPKTSKSRPKRAAFAGPAYRKSLPYGRLFRQAVSQKILSGFDIYYVRRYNLWQIW